MQLCAALQFYLEPGDKRYGGSEKPTEQPQSLKTEWPLEALDFIALKASCSRGGREKG